MRLLIVLSLSVFGIFAQYETEYSGYGDNDQHAVQKAAKKSPYNKPVDYTNNGKSHDAPGGVNINELLKNKIDTQTLAQLNQQGQTNVQKGGEQTNVGVNTNAVNVGQSNYQQTGKGTGSYQPTYDVPKVPSVDYKALIKNYIATQYLGQSSSQGQENVQQGGDQTNAGESGNTVDAGQINYMTYTPSKSHDAPSIPNFNYNELVKNYITNQQLGQVNSQGQENVQKGGDQTNVGENSNIVNAGQTNYQANAGKGYEPGYQGPFYGPSYPSSDAPSSAPAFNYNELIGNLFKTQTIGQSSTQGQANAQIGGAQTNVGQNQNAVTVGQSNYQSGGGKGDHGGYQPTYDAAGYNPYGTAFLILPNFNFNYLAGNKVSNQQLGQTNQQGQSNYQKGGDQTNVGVNTNTINVAQSNVQSDDTEYRRRRI